MVARRRAVALLALATIGVAAWLIFNGVGTDRRGASVETITISSEAVGREQPVSVVEPDEAGEAAGTDLTARSEPGGHTSDYWNSRWDEYLRFYSNALARC